MWADVQGGVVDLLHRRSSRVSSVLDILWNQHLPRCKLNVAPSMALDMTRRKGDAEDVEDALKG